MTKPQRGDWFEALFGFKEGDYAWTQQQFDISGTALTSLHNQQAYCIGHFTTPTLAELRAMAPASSNRSSVTHIVVNDIFEAHADPAHRGDLFQVASQFNALEFISPTVTPEMGVTGYANDPTQGPACALAAAPATVYRNYFAPVGQQIGQTHDRQINNLDALARALGNSAYWQVSNGYTDSTPQQLALLNSALADADRHMVMGQVKIGLQTGVDVAFSRRFEPLEKPHRVSQAFCSAISCGYSRVPGDLWAPLAQLVLDASYEATLLATAIDRASGEGSGRVWLTQIGGGVFANNAQWITDAMQRAIAETQHLGLDIVIAHFGKQRPPFSELSL